MCGAVGLTSFPQAAQNDTLHVGVRRAVLANRLVRSSGTFFGRQDTQGTGESVMISDDTGRMTSVTFLSEVGKRGGHWTLDIGPSNR